MTVWGPHWLKTFYRREPLVSMVATVGVVDAALGGFSAHWSLLAVGVSTVAGAIALYWWQRRRFIHPLQRSPIHVLPPSSSRTSLPPLRLTKNNSPGKR